MFELASPSIHICVKKSAPSDRWIWVSGNIFFIRTSFHSARDAEIKLFGNKFSACVRVLFFSVESEILIDKYEWDGYDMGESCNTAWNQLVFSQLWPYWIEPGFRSTADDKTLTWLPYWWMCSVNYMEFTPYCAHFCQQQHNCMILYTFLCVQRKKLGNSYRTQKITHFTDQVIGLPQRQLVLAPRKKLNFPKLTVL